MKAFLGEVKTEMKKVDWPTKQRVVNLTVVVLIIVIVMAAYLFVVDVGLGNFLFK